VGTRLADLSAALQWLSRSRPEMEALLRRLVDINSFSENKSGADACGAVLQDALASCSLRLTSTASARFGNHLVFETAACGREKKNVVILGHLDTVFPPGTFEGFRPSGDRATGPGVFDMKGGLVVIGFALRALHTAGFLDRIPVQLAAVTDEEAGSPESRHVFAKLWPSAACALCFESGRDGDRIVTQRKGTAYVHVDAFGKAAHAGNAHRDGANAIWSLARFIDRAQSLTDYDRGTAITVGIVSGGQSRNTVPDRAECDVDLRYQTVAEGQALFKALERAATEAPVPGTRVEVKLASSRPPMERTAATEALAKEYGACQRDAGLLDGEFPLAGGGSDAAFASEAGVPAIDGLGPRGSGFHTRAEAVDLASLVPKAEALVRFLWRRHERG
jgi:glutamate carboxypeptidase